MEQNDQQRHHELEVLTELISEIPVAMLTTCLPDHSLHSRPMVNVNRTFQGDLWFFTDRDDPKVSEIQGNPQVNVSFAMPSTGRYVTVSGHASIVQDRKRQELLWQPECQQWLPEGAYPDHLVLIKVDVMHVEYWDAKRNRMVAAAGFLKHMADAGQSAAVDHGRIDW